MATSSNVSGNQPPAPSRPVPAMYRQPLGLPAGSVRAILTFIVLGLVWTVMLLPNSGEIPLYLYYLMFLCLGSFFAAHGHSISGPHSPLYLPRGTLRILIILGFLGVVGWKYYVTRDWNEVVHIKTPAVGNTALPLVLLGGFFAGVFFWRIFGRMLSGPYGPPPWFQDILAWLALLATIGMGAEVIYHGFIKPGLSEEIQNQLTGSTFQMILAGITGFYFGARS
ncbi:MAG TPA: hypothetical protein VGY66_13515 [Gemmataceae bacterium]|jgi:hypothetical protein|nr:hypothetical protein [Gemmataceae bacterium]